MSVAKHFRVVGYILCQDYVDSRDAIKGIATLFPKKVSASIQECKVLYVLLPPKPTLSFASRS